MGARRFLIVTFAVACSVSPVAGGGVAAGSVARTGGLARAAASSARQPRLTPVELQMREVVLAWSARLNAGDNAGVAELFSTPALLIQGPNAYRLTTRPQIALWHSLLPCAGKVQSITYKGRFATAVFRLGHRPGKTCDAPGGTAAARFEIVGGKIRSWMQVAVPSSKPLASGPVT